MQTLQSSKLFKAAEKVSSNNCCIKPDIETPSRESFISNTTPILTVGEGVEVPHVQRWVVQCGHVRQKDVTAPKVQNFSSLSASSAFSHAEFPSRNRTPLPQVQNIWPRHFKSLLSSDFIPSWSHSDVAPGYRRRMKFSIFSILRRITIFIARNRPHQLA